MSYYEPEMVSIFGKLVRKTFPGQPNFESIKDGDAEETGFYLLLKAPICTVAEKHGTENLESQDGIRLVQLVLEQRDYEQLRPMLGKTVKVNGTLFEAFTGHHHAPLLLNFVAAEAVR